MKDFSPLDVIVGFVNFAFSFAILGLLLRFLLRLFGADSTATFTEFVYNSTQPLLYPFRGVFDPYQIGNEFILGFSTLLAMAIYMIVAFLLVELITYVEYASRIRSKKRK